jgi:Asp-tRNA(Asn)/Glu-tRNA(Gln) amidotransferase A subunit family amidase
MIGDYAGYDALGLAELVRTRQVSAAELLETVLDRVATLNPGLNAIVTPLYEQAREAVKAGLPEGPFTGVPYVFKELVVSVEGAPTTSASRLFADNMPAADSEIVRRCRQAGLVVIGKTNSSEFGLSAATEPALFGATRNPWDLSLSPGGSSGGSAAAVAAGLLPMGHASDGGGSIRIPAACCGLFGLKPTRARITAGPEGGEGLAGLANQHAVTWSVRDSAALLDATAGPMPGDPYFAPPPKRPCREEAGRDPDRLRIAYSTRSLHGTPIDPEIIAATEKAARLCGALGHEVIEALPAFDLEAVRHGFAAAFAANCMASIARATGGRLPPEGAVEPLTRAIAERGLAMPAADYIRHLQALHRESRAIARFFQQYDIWLTPTLAMLPRPTGYFDVNETDVDRWLDRLLAFTPFAFLANITGQPAMSVPLGECRIGLPIGCHFTARYGEEGLLFQLAGQLERTRPWFHHRPPKCGAAIARE